MKSSGPLNRKLKHNANKEVFSARCVSPAVVADFGMGTLQVLFHLVDFPIYVLIYPRLVGTCRAHLILRQARI